MIHLIAYLQRLGGAQESDHDDFLEDHVDCIPLVYDTGYDVKMCGLETLSEHDVNKGGNTLRIL